MLTKGSIMRLGAFLCLTSILTAAPLVERPADDFSIVEPSGRRVSVADCAGQVVLMEFLYTTCPHCQATARVFDKLQKELGPRGLRVIGVAFNDEAEEQPDEIRRFIELTGVHFPVGIAPREAVIRYLGISVLSRYAVPQILIIDRNGMVRAQSSILGTEDLVNEAKLRPLLEGLLSQKKTARSSPATANARPR
jgi:peroxiredoxin